jgi:drug/metabolite transporter (DMT)-like permease
VKATNYLYLQSLFTMVFASLILHERITWMAIAGAAILILGMIRAERK